MAQPLTLTRAQILSFRMKAGQLDQRAPMSTSALRRSAWAGIQDSMPRAALLSIHARVRDATARTWSEPPLAQVWGPRFSVYVVSEADRAVFTLGRHPTDEPSARRAEELAERLATLLGDREMSYSDAGRAMGVNPNALRYAATTGRVALRWEGSGKPTIWMTSRPNSSVEEAQLELLRRYLHVFGPGDVGAFGQWAGIKAQRARDIWSRLLEELVAVETPVGPRHILMVDEEAFTRAPIPVRSVRLLPSGDSYYLYWGDDRRLLVPDAGHRESIWTSRVWPGAVVRGVEVVGTWRRSKSVVSVNCWTDLSRSDRDEVVREARSFPLPNDVGNVEVRWE